MLAKSTLGAPTQPDSKKARAEIRGVIFFIGIRIFNQGKESGRSSGIQEFVNGEIVLHFLKLP